jgi:phosphoglycerol transferase MdoB-like AlkP superfamily enzyme
MKKRISVFFLYLFYWYVLFVLVRAVFLIVYFQKTQQLPVSEIFSTFIYGFKLDIAIASYIALLPSLLLAFSSFFKGRFIKYFYNIYTAIALLFVTVIIIGDLFMYKYWGFRIDATPLFYMTNLKAMTASVSIFTVIGGIVAVVLITGLLYLTYSKLFGKLLDSLKKDYKSAILLIPATLLLLVVMRGGVSGSSLSTSSAYFSKNQFANHAAINPVWNVGFSISESGDLEKKYMFYPEAEMKKLLAPLQTENIKSVNLLRNNRPNIILFITESLTAKALEATGGRPGIMPQLNQLVKEGVLFDQFYAASDRTDKGMAAVLAGYPSLPGSSPLKYQKLTQKFNFIPQKLNAEGYRSEFYYGGTLVFANYQAFLVQAGYDKMVSDKDFPKSDPKTPWGEFDHAVFNRCLADTPDGDNKFFKTVLTLTSHEPYITPVPTVIKGDDEDSKYLNSLHYTDACFGDFIKVAKTRKWWDNTLIIIIADHGSMRPGNSENWEKLKYHIPMIWLGGALNVQDTVISNLASQTDLAATLLSQLDIQADDFKFSKNILTKGYIPYSFFTYAGGFGFLKPGDLSVYNTITNTYTESTGKNDSINEKQGKAYLQSLYIDVFNKNK